jgi:hypothetical protein
MMSNNFVEVLRDIASSVFGTAACVYTGQPFDTIKVRLQCVPSDAQGGALKCFTNTIQKEGFMALWRGSIPAFTGQLGENMMAFGVNGLLNRIFKQHGISDESMARNYISGFIYEGFYQFVIPTITLFVALHRFGDRFMYRLCSLSR